jgi:hypothetical protein
MTPQERKLIDELFDRLASLEGGPRDADAAQAINEGLRRAPNALYPLVQTALVQDEALKRADARIRELESELDLEPGEPVQQPGFLDSMRDAFVGRRQSQGSVPSVRPGAPAASPWGNMGGNAGDRSGAYAASPQAPGYGGGPGGGSFLGTAAATAAGVVGGALLMNSFRGMFGNAHASPASAYDSGNAGSPWTSAGNSDAARDAGINDIGSGSRTASLDDSGSQRAGLFDTAQNDDSDDDYDDNADDDDSFDLGDDSDGGSDNA